MPQPSDSHQDAEESQRLLSTLPSTSEAEAPAPSSNIEAKKVSTLVIPVAAEKHAATATSPASPAVSPTTADHELGKDKDSGICRICLEEDLTSNLEVPCGCTGTQKYAHHDCIQRWVNEKGHLKCEICEQQYRGEFTVPPQGIPVDDMTMFSPMYIRVDGDGLHERGGLDLLDESDHYYQRNPAASWCFTFVIFVMFLVVLHHTMIVADGMDMGDGTDGTNTTDGGGSSGGGSTEADAYATSLTLFLFWVGTKAFLIGIPLYTVMKIAARQARREQYEAMLRAGTYDNNNRRLMFRMRVRESDPAAAAAPPAQAQPTGPNAV